MKLKHFMYLVLPPPYLHFEGVIVKSWVFGPMFLARNDYIERVPLQTCWMHLLFVSEDIVITFIIRIYVSEHDINKWYPEK